MTRSVIAALVVALLVAPSVARANGDAPADGPATTFERFALSACTPCIRESYPVGVLATTPLALPGFPRVAAGVASRPGEIAIEVVRARQLGRPDWQSLALRLTLSILGGGDEMYRLGVGLLDGVEAPALAKAVAEMAQIATASPANPGVETADIDFHGGSLRIGVLRLRGDSVAYLQTGSLPALMQRTVWEVPTTLYLPVKDLPALAAALSRAAATIEKVRGN